MASIRETPAGAGPAGAQRPLPASGNLTADARALPVGEVVAARVVAGEGGADLLLELAGQRVTIPSRLDLPAGSTVAVRVDRSGDGLRLTPVTSEALPTLPTAVAEALRQALPRQSSLAGLLPLLARLTGGTVTGQPATAPAFTGAAAPQATASPPTGSGVTLQTTTGVAIDTLADGSPPPATGASAAAAGAAAGLHGASANSRQPPTLAADAAGESSEPTERQPGVVAGRGYAATGPRLPSLESLLQASGRTTMEPADAAALPSAGLAARLIGREGSRTASGAATGTATQPTQARESSRAGEQVLVDDGDPRSGGEGGSSRLARLAATAPELPPRVTAALSALAEQVPGLDDLRDGTRLARVVERAGLMLEAHLATREPPSGADIAADLKAALLRVRASVDEGGRGREGPAPGSPAVATEASRTALLQALGDSVDGTLARITVNQIQAAAVADSGPVAFSFEIPLRDADGRYQPLQFEFEREAEDTGAQRPPTSTVTLRMQPPGLGPVTAVLRLGGEQIATELWAEQPETRALLFHTSERLAAQLRSVGLEVSAIRLSDQPPRRSVAPAIGTRSLIETKV